VVSGPSGAGKGTLIKGALERIGDLAVAVSATTRAMRPGEVDGREYHFMSRAEFARLVESGAFLEHAEFAGNRYGTLNTELDRIMDSGRSVILEIELQGARNVRVVRAESVSVFIEPPSLEELARRLRARATDADEEIEARLEVARTEVAAKAEFDHVILNDEIGRATDELVSVIESEVEVASGGPQG
jgi:guanylate kinase